MIMIQVRRLVKPLDYLMPQGLSNGVFYPVYCVLRQLSYLCFTTVVPYNIR